MTKSGTHDKNAFFILFKWQCMNSMDLHLLLFIIFIQDAKNIQILIVFSSRQWMNHSKEIQLQLQTMILTVHQVQ